VIAIGLAASRRWRAESCLAQRGAAHEYRVRARSGLATRDAAQAGVDACRPLLDGAPRLELAERPVRAIEDFHVQRGDAPNIGWPDDRAWCVASEIDLMRMYVGGSRALIDAIVADDHLEAVAVSVDELVTWEADAINPLPAPP
jgi:hypothetical protein